MTSGASGSRPSSRSTVEKLERLIDELNGDRSARCTNFLLPRRLAGCRAAARRAERSAVEATRAITRVARRGRSGKLVLPYPQPLSDALFVMARYENHERGVDEPLWQPGL
jgi:cob(I)alamin adenosyltransferase